ncbi:MAG: sigma-54 dependent transcriptional regulator [Gemmatimonadota bacterium]
MAQTKGGMSRILVIDDIAPMAEQYAYDLHRLAGHDVSVATDGDTALKQLAAERFDCVILDLEMPLMDGFDVLRAMHHRGHEVPVIVYTGTGDFSRCVQAVRLGAAGFIDKAEPMERVIQEVEGAIERQRLRFEVRLLQQRLGESELSGVSPAMKHLRETIAKVAPVPSTVLLLGESGSGKEVAARELHRLGGTPSGPFVAINCGALPENLVESELFGHERGAFTGAVATRKGAFETAEKGTLFLDEIGELPPSAQAKLLRVLEERIVTRVGTSRGIPVHTRVIAATNRDLDREVREGRFREDLLYRLNVHTIRVPPLRDRAEDIVRLAEQFLDETCRRFGVLPKRLSGEARAVLLQRDWKRNNVRELRNCIERAVVTAEGEVVRAEHLSEPASPTTAGAESATYQDQKTQAERRIVLGALERHEWQVTRTAEALGLADHASLLKIMRRLGITRE